MATAGRFDVGPYPRGIQTPPPGSIPLPYPSEIVEPIMPPLPSQRSGPVTTIEGVEYPQMTLPDIIAIAGTVFAPTSPAPTLPPVIEPTPVMPPATVPTPSTPTAPPILDEIDRSIEEAARRAAADSAIRRGEGTVIDVITDATRIPGRILGPIGAVIDIATPSELGSGELSPGDMIEQVLRDAEDVPEPSFGEDIARGGGVVVGGITLGGQVILDGIGGFPPMPPDPGEPPVSVQVPMPTFPIPGISQPEVPWNTAPPPPLPAAPPAPVISSPPAPGSSSTFPSPSSPPSAGTGTMAPPGPLQGGWSALLSGLIVARNRARRSSSIPTQWPFPSTLVAPTPSPQSLPGASSLPSTAVPGSSLVPGSVPGLTPFNALRASSPPRSPTTRTRTRECECKPKKRKPARKCAERGNVVWQSGSKKGQLAGSRCVRWEK